MGGGSLGTRVTFFYARFISGVGGRPHFPIPHLPSLLPPPLISRLNPDGDSSAKTILDVTLYISSAGGAGGALGVGGGGGPVGHCSPPPLKRPYSITQYPHPQQVLQYLAGIFPHSPPGPHEEGKEGARER